MDGWNTNFVSFFGAFCPFSGAFLLLVSGVFSNKFTEVNWSQTKNLAPKASHSHRGRFFPWGNPWESSWVDDYLEDGLPWLGIRGFSYPWWSLERPLRIGLWDPFQMDEIYGWNKWGWSWPLTIPGMILQATTKVGKFPNVCPFRLVTIEVHCMLCTQGIHHLNDNKTRRWWSFIPKMHPCFSLEIQIIKENFNIPLEHTKTTLN